MNRYDDRADKEARIRREQKALDDAIASKGNGKADCEFLEETAPEWPVPLAEAAYYGLAGEIVRAIEPDTESDPAALLVQTLVAFGATVGRGAYFQVEGDRHHGNLFAIIIGRTSKARKGTSWGRVREILDLILNRPRVVTGLSTGEGLKYMVRDATPAKSKKRKFKRDHRDPFYEEDDDADPGVTDKRLIAVESEFGQVLRVGPRKGNTLSMGLRDAWESGNLATLTRHDPLTATGAHISVIGHITAEELRSCLTPVEIANGFANRFLMVCAERSKILPEGGEPLDPAVSGRFAGRLARCAGLAEGVGRVRRTEEATGLWASVYPGLSGEGGVTGRAEAQVIRLSMLYALLDESAKVDAVHVEAALAVWAYCEASVRCVFRGDIGGEGNPALGDLMSERMLKWILKTPQGQTTRQLYRRFGCRISTEHIIRTAQGLEEVGLVSKEIRIGVNGRAVDWWSPVMGSRH